MKVPQTPPDHLAAFAAAMEQAKPGRMFALLDLVRSSTSDRPDYPHWDKLRHLTPPDGFTSTQWWSAVRTSRAQSARELPLRQVSGAPFTYNLTDPMLRLMDEISRLASGQIAIEEQVTNPASRDRYIVSSLIEEAITSSQLEGAVTTRKVAKDMLRQGRPPRDHSELMIVNNYAAMNRIVDIRDEPLTPELVKEIHRIVVDGALADPTAAGQVQTPTQDRVSVWSTSTNEVVHEPPRASELPQRLQQLCDFANGDDARGYLPPLLRALAVHFMTGYDHYFVDGNGRTARALFYWSMLHEGFWLAEFLTVSRILHRAPAQYGRSFLLTETDGGDLTYFLLYHLDVIRRSIDDLRHHLEQSVHELRSAQESLRVLPTQFNHRQLAVLSHALEHPGFNYTAESHAHSHRVTNQTARSDLHALTKAQLLIQERRGRQYVWVVPQDLHERIAYLQ